MVAVRIFATFIKKFINMIDKRKFQNMSGGEMHFGLEVLLFVVGIFILWVLAGGAKKPPEEQKPFITPLTDPTNPGEIYGPSGFKN